MVIASAPCELAHGVQRLYDTMPAGPIQEELLVISLSAAD